MALPRRVMLAAAISYTYVQGSWDPLFIQPSVVGARSSAQILPKELPPPPTFTLHTSAMDFAGAEAVCNADGGHIVYYDNAEQQKEVGGLALIPAARIFPVHSCASKGAVRLY